MHSQPRTSLERFQDTARFLKAADGLGDLTARALPIGGLDEQYWLVPVAQVHREHVPTAELMAEWRDAHQYAYPSRFEVTVEGTQTWISKAVLDNDDRLLFLICDNVGNPIGHLGLVCTSDEDVLEVDNVLRGVRGAPGIMRAAMLALEEWVDRETASSQLVLRVLESNSRARDFYRKLGYLDIDSQDMVWEKKEGSSQLVAGSPAEERFIQMGVDVVDRRPSAQQILTAGPSIGSQEVTYVDDAVRNGWNSHHSDYLNAFETQFGDFVGSPHAMATSSCTGALHLALLALGIGPGDEVIVPEITWVATAAAVNYVGAKPVFVDVDEVCWGIDPQALEAAITPATKAVMPVHLYGYPADMTRIMEIARTHGLFVVEDAAPAIGATIADRAVGTFGDFGCYSFQGAKMLVTGEGGMLVTPDADLRAKAWKQQDHGRKPGTFLIEEVGRKYKMSNATAALGLGQIERAEVQIFQKRRINAWYHAALDGRAGIRMQTELPGSQAIHWMNSIFLEDGGEAEREVLVQALRKEGIDSRPVFPPISQYQIWGYDVSTAAPVAARIGASGINLPSGVRLSKASVDRVSDVLLNAFEELGW